MAYTSKKKYNSKNKGKVKIFLSLNVLDQLILYSMSSNSLVTKKSLINLKRLIDIMDEEIYNEDVTLMGKFIFLREILILQIDKKIVNYQLVKEHMETFESPYLDSEAIEDTFYMIEATEDMSNEEVEYLAEIVQDRLLYSHFFKEADNLESALNELRTTQGSFRGVNERLEEVISTVYKAMKSSKVTNKFAAEDFALGSEDAEHSFEEAIEELNKPSNHIKMGSKWLNDMFGGGLENGRCYLFFGLPKSFKSGILLNIALWACKYNKYETKDPTKVPGVVYLTQENSKRETIARIFTHCTGEDIKHYSYSEAVSIVRKEIKERYGVELIIKYRPHKSISTQDLAPMIDEMAELEGIECVLLVQDYTKRIRSSINESDIRLELGEVVNDFCVLAKEKNIPVVSAGQLNREGYRILENSIASNRSNIAKNLNASHVGESALMIENTDYGVIVNPEKVESLGEKYLTFKMIASRANEAERSYFAHPFENGMRLIEDVELAESVAIESIGDNLTDFNPNNARENIMNKINNVQQNNNPAVKRPGISKQAQRHLDPNSNDINF